MIVRREILFLFIIFVFSLCEHQRMVDQRILIAIIVVLVILYILCLYSDKTCEVCKKPVSAVVPNTVAPAITPQQAEIPWKTRQVSTGVYPNTDTLVCLYKGDRFTCQDYAQCLKGANAEHDVTTPEYAKCGTGSDPSLTFD